VPQSASLPKITINVRNPKQPIKTSAHFTGKLHS
jgi:hypothetical protein